ncbi:MAG: DedA family protein [Acidobacteria bacterium]|nr:DedA family protein [Acidobacteriota bacterium]
MLARVRAWTRKIYAQSQEWAKSPNCMRDLTILSIISCTIIPIPVEAPLIAIISASPKRWFRVVLSITLGSILGALICYLLGRLLLGQAVYLLQYFTPIDNWEEVKSSVSNEGMLYLAIASFTPGLFRIGMVAAGVIGYNIILFAISVTIGRLIRFSLEAALLRIFGDKLRIFLEKHFDIVSLVMGLLGLLILLIMKFIE